ncbi:hypothetical protein ACE193_11735 [Bernardetia sp. OM2101]|uniref:hypothetical protein n=1 Tax=Bernardetia sp. OM2101 TaxID=3344876 RepID=UPI0035CEA598
MKNRHPNRTVLIGFLINSIIAIFILITVYAKTTFTTALDIQFHDTYFVATVSDVLASILQFFFLYFLLYLVLHFSKKNINNKTAKTHYYITTFIAVCLSSFLIVLVNIDFPKRYFSHEEYKPLFPDFYGLFTPLFIFYIFIQISFFFYLIFTIKKIT